MELASLIKTGCHGWHVLRVLIRLAGFMSGLRVSPKRTCRLHFDYIRHGLTGQQ